MRKRIIPFFSKRAIIFILTIAFFANSCTDDEAPRDITNSDEVAGLKFFGFLAGKNDALFQDIEFTKQADNSYEVEIAHDVDLSKIIPSFDYAGKVMMNGSSISKDNTVMAFPDEFVVQFDNNHVIFRIHRKYTIPTIYIHTENGIGVHSKEEYVYCALKIDGKNMTEDFSAELADSVKIRGRGNSTWKYYDKKPYRIKLDTKSSLLGMSAAKSWVLLANYRDPTNFMNAISFDMARYMEMPFTNSNQFVEVYLDDNYIGMYQLTEQVQEGENRVEVDKEKGLLLNLDLDDGPHYSPDASDNFYSTFYKLPICVKHPEKLTTVEIEAIKADFADVENSIRNRNYTALSKRLDIKSFIDFLIIQEITRNVELVSPRSMYMYKDIDNVYHFGPVWDFDGGFAFNWASMSSGHGYFGSQSWLMGSSNPSNHPADAYNYISGFFVNMFGNPQFLSAYQARWAELEPGMMDYCFSRLDDYVLHCESAMIENAKRWPIGKDYQEEIEKMKTWLRTRATNYSVIVKNY